MLIGVRASDREKIDDRDEFDKPLIPEEEKEGVEKFGEFEDGKFYTKQGGNR